METMTRKKQAIQAVKEIYIILKSGCIYEVKGMPKGYRAIICDQDEQESYEATYG